MHWSCSRVPPGAYASFVLSKLPAYIIRYTHAKHEQIVKFTLRTLSLRPSDFIYIMKGMFIYFHTTPHRELLTLSIIYAIFKENLRKTEMYTNDKAITRLRFVQSNMGFLFSFYLRGCRRFCFSSFFIVFLSRSHSFVA